MLLADPLRNGDEVVVPTDSLFIEMLCGSGTLLEGFKLRHRELDVYTSGRKKCAAPAWKRCAWPRG